MNKSISIIIPAYNEEGNLEGATQSVIDAVNFAGIEDYEILIFNDCSTDKTGEVADKLAKENKNIRVIHNSQNMGMGYSYVKGVQLAEKEFVTLIPGDNEIRSDAIGNILKELGKADIVMSYSANPEVRTRSRQIISKTFVKLLNFLFRLNVRYYHGVCLIRTNLARTLNLTNYGFGYLAETVVKLIRSGYGFIELPMYIQPRKYGKASAFKLKNVARVGKTILRLYWEIYFKERKKYNKYKKQK